MKYFARRAVTFLAVACSSGLSQAQGQGLHQWQPCPDLLSRPQAAEPQAPWDLTLSPYTLHWSPSDQHKPVRLVALDRRTPGNGFCGVALFSNSFGQPSVYAYVGQRWDGLLGHRRLFTKVSAGLIHGYRGEHRDKIPANQLGIAPAIIPSLGYAFTPADSAQVFVLGTAGVLFSYVRSF